MSSVDKIHKMLELLRTHYRNGLTNKEISEKLKIPPSTCYRILSALKTNDLVYQRKPDMHYFLGFAHLRYAEAVMQGMDLPAICLPYLEDLHSESEETTFFAYFNGKTCVVMEICGYVNMRISVGLGETMPLHGSATGKAVLAFLPQRERERILASTELEQYTRTTITTPEAIEKEMEQVRQTGISYIFEEFHNGINAVATPIFGQQKRVLGSISMVGTAMNMTGERMTSFGLKMLKASYEITSQIGGFFPDNLAVPE